MSNRKSPKMLENVINAIANLQDSDGSSLRRIVNHIHATNRRGRGRKADITPLVRDALAHAQETGVITKNDKKYQLVSGSRSACGHCSQKKRRRSRSRSAKKSSKRRRRRQTSETSEASSKPPSKAASAEDTQTTNAQEEGRSERQAKKRRRSVSRQREPQEDNEIVETENNNEGNNNEENNNEENNNEGNNNEGNIKLRRLSQHAEGYFFKLKFFFRYNCITSDESPQVDPVQLDEICNNADCLCRIEPRDGDNDDRDEEEDEDDNTNHAISLTFG